jgi:hypothetical protein
VNKITKHKIVVDGFAMENLFELQLEMGTYDDHFRAGEFSRVSPSMVQASLLATNGTRLEFRVEGKETIGDTTYFYGPLRHLFPSMFADIDPLPWQVGYLEFSGRPSLDRFKVRRNDPMFLTDSAKAFFNGWSKGFMAGRDKQAQVVMSHNEAQNATYKEEYGNKLRKDYEAKSSAVREAFLKKRGM